MKRSAPAAVAAPAPCPAPSSFSIGAFPFFLQASPGQRFCMYYPPAQGQPVRGAILYVHPFAEELNKSRRMAALQARAFSRSGYAVLQIDLYGCGDSSGDFADARWHIWTHDLLLACDWLAHQERGPLSLWGLRLGALLALELAGQAPVPVERLILWHPLHQGRQCIDQLLRQQVASRMLADAHASTTIPDGARSTSRQHLANGLALDIGGYTLAPALIERIDQLDLANVAPACPVFCFEQAGPAGLSRPALQQADRWRAAGVSVKMQAIDGLAFWNGGDVLECAALLDATAALLA